MAESLPAPSAAALLAALGPEVHTIPAGAELWRVYARAGLHPGAWDRFRHYGPTSARFDHHEPPPRDHAERGILYAADRGPTCLAEVFQDTRTIDRQLDEPALAVFRTTRSLDLLDVTGAWPTRAGASMAIGTGNRVCAREWSRAIYLAFPRLAGIRYASSMDANRPAFALYERAAAAVPASALLDEPLSRPGLAALLARAAACFGYRLR